MIILASSSPTRKSMLTNAGLSFTAASPAVDEGALLATHPEWTPAEASRNLAEAKAIDVSRQNPGNIVIGADQVLAFEGRIYSKPVDLEAARRQLLQLRGHTHELISTVVCVRDCEPVWTHSSAARLTVRGFSAAFLEEYLEQNGNNLLSSVGAYQIEGQGSQLFESIDGDYFTILGLPLLPLMQFLRGTGDLRT